MHELFRYEGFQVRVVGEPDAPWWVVSDVCEVLEHTDPHKAVSGLDDDEKGRKTVPTPGGDQEVWCVNESGLYSLVLKSRKAKAKQFKKWITSEVIPAIRRTGTYTVPTQPVSSCQMLLVMAQQLVEQEQRQLEQERRVALVAADVKQLQADTGTAKRLAVAAVDIHTSNYGHYTVLGYCNIHGLPCDIKTAAKHGAALSRLCKAKGIPITQVRDPRFGKVNQYPEAVMNEYFQDAGGVL